MITETIEIEVQTDIAKLYNSASEEDKEKLQTLFEMWLKEYSASDVGSLKETMDEISRNAQSKGLTPEILESMLSEK
jgi:hypothetical protein